MGPRMLGVAGRLADGIVPGMAGVGIIDSYIVPTLTEAARAAGRATPRIAVALPVALVAGSEVDTAREFINRRVGVIRALPPYRRMFEMQGIDGPADISLIGDESAITAGLRRLADAGLSEYLAMCVP